RAHTPFGRRLAPDELARQHVRATSHQPEHGPIGHRQKNYAENTDLKHNSHVQSAKYLWERRFCSSLREAIVARGGIRVTLGRGRAGRKCQRTEVAKCRE